MGIESTLPRQLLKNAREIGAQDAIREKSYGIWETFTWSDYAKEVRRFALGLAALGFKRGDKLAVIGDNRPPLYFAMIAAQSLAPKNTTGRRASARRPLWRVSRVERRAP